MAATLPHAPNPLAGTPSVLAIRDLRRRTRRALENRSLSDADLVQLLELDPLAVLRGLRAAAAPVFGGGPARWSVRTIVQSLGPALSRRLLDAPTLGIAGTTPLRHLWLHAVATATAARDLAQTSGLMSGDEAYLLGLLHDLPRWLHLVARHQRGAPFEGTAAQWAAHWQFPDKLAAVLSEREALLEKDSMAPATALVTAAETLAELAEFVHPDDPVDPGVALASAGRDDLVAAQQLRREVAAVLRRFGLGPELPDFDAEYARGDDDDEQTLFGGTRRGHLDEVVLSVLSCARSQSYRGLVTALTAASVRYGGYDRAFYVKWHQAQQVLVIRTKADSSARRVVQTRIRPSAAEVEVMRRALQEERPARLDGPPGRAAGLLTALSTDEVLVVPLNREFSTPSFLVLDRSLTLRPIQLVHDAATATTLGMTGSLLNENLLLRRRRQRAQQFALIDPLTRLYNRRMGVQTLDQEIARAGRSGQPLSVLLCDLDHFKKLNDTYGHLQGDQALRTTADVLRQTLRRSDVICRFGGEEFLVVLPDTAPAEATVLATRLFTAIEAKGNEIGLPVTVSIGLTALRPVDTVESLLHRADQALYASKGFGRNRFSADVEDNETPPDRKDTP